MKKSKKSVAFNIDIFENKIVKQKPLTGVPESCMIAKVITDGEICRADIFI